MKKYIPIEGTKYIKLETFYDLGGMNYFINGINRRGYYVSARYVEKDDHMESCVLGEGFKRLIIELKRNNKKAEKIADDYLIEHEKSLIETLKSCKTTL